VETGVDCAAGTCAAGICVAELGPDAANDEIGKQANRRMATARNECIDGPFRDDDLLLAFLTSNHNSTGSRRLSSPGLALPAFEHWAKALKAVS